MYVTVDEPWQDREARCIDGLGVTWHGGPGALAGMCHAAFIDHDSGFARRLAGGRVEKPIGVDRANHDPMLMAALSRTRLGAYPFRNESSNELRSGRSLST